MLKSGLTADSVALVLNCRMDTYGSAELSGHFGPVSMVPKCLGSEVSLCTPWNMGHTNLFTVNKLATEPSRRFPYFSATEPSRSCRVHSISLFLSFLPTKDLSPFSIHTPQKPSFKLMNDQFIVAGICWVQLNQPTLDFGSTNPAVHLAQIIPL